MTLDCTDIQRISDRDCCTVPAHIQCIQTENAGLYRLKYSVFQTENAGPYRLAYDVFQTERCTVPARMQCIPNRERWTVPAHIRCREHHGTTLHRELCTVLTYNLFQTENVDCIRVQCIQRISGRESRLYSHAI